MIDTIIVKILQLCGKNKILFTLKKEDDGNYIKLTDKDGLIINISDYKDKGLEKLLTSKLEELQDFFK